MYPSTINFTEKHHTEIANLFDYSNLSKDEINKCNLNLERSLFGMSSPKYLYIVRSGNINLYKIGITKDIDQRLNTLQIGNPEKIHPIAFFCADLSDPFGREIFYLERFLHKNFENKRIQGEWFKLNLEEICDICYFLECSDRELETWTNEDTKEIKAYEKRFKVPEIESI